MSKVAFRAKRKENELWEYGHYFFMMHTDHRHSHEFLIPFGTDLSKSKTIGEIQVEIIPETIGKYIQTVNNHDIFTKDIVKAYKHGDLESKPFIREITERVGTYWFGNWTWLEFLNIFRYVEIIGNSVDNPGLVDKE